MGKLHKFKEDYDQVPLKRVLQAQNDNYNMTFETVDHNFLSPQHPQGECKLGNADTEKYS